MSRRSSRRASSRSFPRTSGSSSARWATRTIPRARFRPRSIFIAGFTTVFAGLGAIAGLLGSSLSTFQNGVRVVGGVVDHRHGARAARRRARPLRRERRLIPTAAEGHRRRAALRRRRRVRRGLEPVRRAVARGRAHDRGAVAAASAGARSCSCAYALGIGVPFLARRARARVVTRPRRTAAADRPEPRARLGRVARRARRAARDQHLRPPHVVPGALRPRRARALARRRSGGPDPPTVCGDRGRRSKPHSCQPAWRGDTAVSSSGSRHHTARARVPAEQPDRGAVGVGDHDDHDRRDGERLRREQRDREDRDRDQQDRLDTPARRSRRAASRNPGRD